jgi:DNA-binding winged helix-turn-helix (wHTH) protein/TolB-like protein
MFFANAGGRVVSKQEILDAVWPDQNVSESALTACISELRQVVGDTGRAPRVLENIPKRGYRLLLPVMWVDDSVVVPPAAPKHNDTTSVVERVSREMDSDRNPMEGNADLRRAFPSPRVVMVMLALVIAIGLLGRFYSTLRARPVGTSIPTPVEPPITDISRLVVLPFENLTREPDDDWLAGAFSDSLTLGLRNLRGVVLVNRERIIELYNLQTLKEAGPLDPQRVHRLSQILNVRYYVHGSYQRVGKQIKVVARLVAADSSVIQVQESITDSFANILEVQDALARRFASTLERGSDAFVALPKTDSLEAYQLFTEGQGAYALRNLDVATRKLERAITLDGRYAQAWSLLSKTYSRLAAPSTRRDAQATYRGQALSAARRAIEIEPALYDAHIALALGYREREEIGPWRAEAQKAIDINPRAAEAYGLLGDSFSAAAVWGCSRNRNASLAEDYYRRAIQIDPRFNTNLVAQLDWVGRPDDALRAIDEELATLPGHPSGLRLRSQLLALTTTRLNESEEAVLKITDGGKHSSAADEWVLGTLDLRRGRLDVAARRFRQALAQSPDSAFELVIARSYLTADRLDLARPHVEHAIEIDRTCAQFVADSVPFKAVRTNGSFRELLLKHGAHLHP